MKTSQISHIRKCIINIFSLIYIFKNLSWVRKERLSNNNFILFINNRVDWMTTPGLALQEECIRVKYDGHLMPFV